MAKLSLRLSDETDEMIGILLSEVGIWKNKSEFVKEAIDEYIKKFLPVFYKKLIKSKQEV